MRKALILHRLSTRFDFGITVPSRCDVFDRNWDGQFHQETHISMGG